MIVLLVACMFAEIDETGPIDLAVVMEQSYNIHFKVYHSFFAMIKIVFDFNPSNKIKVFIVCDGTKNWNLDWKMCDVGW